jgi:Cu(I)/Ag(I) efflux system membrane fusion protein
MELNERLHGFLLCSVVLGVAATLAGCGGSTDKPDQGKPAATPTMSQESDKGNADAGAADQSDAAPGLAKLSPEDRVLAEKQKVCPVSGERLGAMDKPVKITVKGQTVFLCCAGCENAIKKDPDKYLAKLKASGAK